jgi:hypothetical protein
MSKHTPGPWTFRTGARIAFSFLAFGLPEQQRLDRENQEIVYHGR